jgi:hypothetical protein
MRINKWFFLYRPLGLNLRNFLVRDLNSEASLRLAKDKVSFKRLLEKHGILTSRTYHEIHDFSDVGLIRSFPDEFVVKPSRGLGGNGIILLKKEGNIFSNPSGDKYSLPDVKRHIRKILDGDFSGYKEQDMALIEEHIHPSEKLRFKNSIGLPDIRIFCYNFEPTMAMMRYPTLKSKGRSNLAAGAIGIGIDLETGGFTYIHSKKEKKEYLPEEIGIPQSFVMPKWEEMKMIARKSSKLSQLKLSGVDIILDSEDRAVVLEINGRPGLEIQNINENSLLKIISRNKERPPFQSVTASSPVKSSKS